MANGQQSPAFLFYTDNFMGGTMFFTNEQVGIYIRLLCAQHSSSSGSLTKDYMIKVCGGEDKMIFEKFTVDENGCYYNSRLRLEIEKRIAYCQSRSKNRGSEAEPKTAEPPKKKNGSDIKAEKFVAPSLEEVMAYFKENGYSQKAAETAFMYYNTANWKDKNGSQVKNWKQKMISVWFKDENKTDKPKEELKYAR